MKTGRSIQDLAAEIQRRSENKVDLVVPTQYLHMEPTIETVRTNDGIGACDKVTGVQIAVRADRPIFDESGAPIPNEFGVNKIAHNQLAEYTGIPARYYQRLLELDPALLADNVNRWLQETKENRMVRTLDGTMRALLSDVYRPLDNEDFARAVLPVISKLGLDIMSCEITDRRLYMKIVDPRVTRELANLGGIFGDGKHIIARGIVCPAVTLSNSEVGDGQVSVLGGVYSDWCTNLASFGERSAKKRHVGKRHELVSDELYAKFSPETRRLSDQATWAQIQETVELSFNEAQFAALVTKIEATDANEIEGKPVEVIKLASKKFGLNESEGDSILEHLIKGGRLTQFGLHNAVTRAAQDVESYDRATELESLGGKIIDLPRKEWVALSNAIALKEAA